MSQASATPDWLMRPELGLCPCGCIGKRRKGSFLDKTLGGAASVMRQAMFADDVAARDGLLQRVDARVKVVTIVGLLVVAAFVRHVPTLLALYAAALGLAAASRISLSFFIKRVWLFVPIFTGIVVVPAAFSFITPGDIVVPLGTWFGTPVGFTAQGLTAAALIVTRVAVSISLVVLLTLTTPWTRLLGALRSLFVPRMFVMVLGMAYRYVFHLLTSVTDMYTARKARIVAASTDTAGGRRFVAATGGALFGKAHALSEEVHLAMVSRGYVGDVRTLEATRLTAADVLWFLATVAAAGVILGGDRLLGR